MNSVVIGTSDGLAHFMSARLRGARELLVQRWLERIVSRVTVSPAKVFPSEELLNHVPLLIDGIADYLAHPKQEFGADAPVIAKAMELGALRHSQGFDAYEILKEHEILGGVIFTYLTDLLADEGVPGSKRDLALCWQRIAHAVELIRQATLMHFLRLTTERANDREGRLRRFNTIVSHELKNRLGAVRGAAGMLAESWLSEDEHQRFIEMLRQNTNEIVRVLDDLEGLSRIAADARQRRNVLLVHAAMEARRQLREPARVRGVDVRIALELPGVEVDAAAVELALINYLSNAIKYSDPGKTTRWIAIDAALRPSQHPHGGAELVVEVRDNGIGVPEAKRARLFEQFYRAHDETVTGVGGTGLGLNIVRETVESMGGRAWAEFSEDGETLFAFSLPSRRAEDAAAAGTKRVE